MTDYKNQFKESFKKLRSEINQAQEDIVKAALDANNIKIIVDTIPNLCRNYYPDGSVAYLYKNIELVRFYKEELMVDGNSLIFTQAYVVGTENKKLECVKENND